MDFNTLATYFQKIEETASRTEMTKILKEMLTSLNPEEVQETLYLMTGRVAPKYDPLEFNIAEKMVIKAISEAYREQLATIKEKYSNTGDLGLVAQELSKSTNQSIGILEVFKQLKAIAEYRGEGSQDKKIQGLANLMKELNPIGARYLVRIVLDKLRLGIGDKTIIDALSWTQTKDKSLSADIERAFGVTSDLGLIGETLFIKGISVVKEFKLTPGRPVAAKLCQREDTPNAIIKRMQKCVIQPKLDGLRCQIHKWDSDKVALFTRNLESITEMFPEIVEAAKKIPCKSVILDSEVIGYNPRTNKFIRFQETIKRRRKYEVVKKAQEIPVYAYAFDILYLNGKDLTTSEYTKRLEKMKSVLSKRQKTIKNIETHMVDSTQKIDALFKKYISEGLEGLIAKTPDHKYSTGKRNYDWVKLKGAFKETIADTIDAVVLGYYKGRGKQAKLGIGAFLAGIYNKKDDFFETIAKVGTGVTDAQWKTIKKTLDQIAVKKIPARVKVSKSLVPDVWVTPKIVSVIKADEITKSPTHTSGYALRFPRLEEFKRLDKTPNESTTVKEVTDLHKKK